MKRITDNSRMTFKLIDGSIETCRMRDWSDEPTGKKHVITKEDVQIVIPLHAIVKLSFELVEVAEKKV